ncbi:hypothetical protein ABPG73_017732 [Tetrahymena malaccensis]
MVLAENKTCQQNNSQQECLDNSQCQFSIMSQSCTSKCSNLATSLECGQQNSCFFKEIGCISKITNCETNSSINITAETCLQINPNCIFNPSVPKCNLKQESLKQCFQRGLSQKLCTSLDYCEFIKSGNFKCVFNTLYECNPSQCNTQYCDLSQECISINQCQGLSQEKCQLNCLWDQALKTCIDNCANLELSQCLTASGCQVKNYCVINQSKGNSVCNIITSSDQDCVANNACEVFQEGVCQPKKDICNVQSCPESICQKFTVKSCNNPTCKIQDPNNCESFCQLSSAQCAAKDQELCLNQNQSLEACETKNSYCQFLQQGICQTKEKGSSSGYKSKFLSLLISFIVLL